MLIHGEELEMETRECAGGCGLTFRCLTTSKTILARTDCHFVCKGSNRTLDEVKLKHAQETQTGPNRYYVQPGLFRRRSAPVKRTDSADLLQNQK